MKVICKDCQGTKFALQNDYILEYVAYKNDLSVVSLPVICFNCKNEFIVEFSPINTVK